MNVSDPHQNRGVPREFHADTLEPYVRTPPLTEPYEPGRAHVPARRGAARDHCLDAALRFCRRSAGITAAVAVRDELQRVMGVATVDFALKALPISCRLSRSDGAVL